MATHAAPAVQVIAPEAPDQSTILGAYVNTTPIRRIMK